MRKKRYDVIVVGCGPAGAIAGKFAALGGAETLIVEEKRQLGFPIYDFMSIIYSKSEMEETIGETIEPAIIYSKAKGLTYISPKGRQNEAQPLPDGIFVNRQLFEKFLAIAAVRAGAELVLHSRVADLVREDGVVTGVIIKDGPQPTPVSCSMVIAADGCYQHMARLAGIGFPRERISAALGCEFVGVKSLGGPHNIAEIYLDGSTEGMYRYVVPYGEDRFSLGCSVGRSAVKQKRSLKQRLDEFIRYLEEIGKYDFSKASPVNMMSGGMGLVVAPKLAADGIILVGNAAGGPVYGSQWGGIGLMLGACWTGRAAGKIAAAAVRKDDVSERSLDGEYRNVINDSLGDEDGTHILEALDAWRQILNLGPEEQEGAVAEISRELAALHFYSKGALPLRWCLEPVQNWLKERKRR